eukprot:tig00020961_g16626.t1
MQRTRKTGKTPASSGRPRRRAWASGTCALAALVLLAIAVPTHLFEGGAVSLSALNPVMAVSAGMQAVLPSSRILPPDATWVMYGGATLDPVIVLVDVQEDKAAVLQGQVIEAQAGTLVDSMAVARVVARAGPSYAAASYGNYAALSNGSLFRVDLFASNRPTKPGFTKFEMRRYDHLTAANLTSCTSEHTRDEPSATCRQVHIFPATTAPAGLPAAAAGGLYVAVSGPVLGQAPVNGMRGGATLLHLLPDATDAGAPLSAMTPDTVGEVEFYHAVAQQVGPATRVFGFARSYLGAWTHNSGFWNKFATRPPPQVATPDALYVLDPGDLSVVARHALPWLHPTGGPVAFADLARVHTLALHGGNATHGGKAYALFYLVASHTAAVLVADDSEALVLATASHRLCGEATEPSAGRRVTGAVLVDGYIYATSSDGRLLKLAVEPFPSVREVTYTTAPRGADLRALVALPRTVPAGAALSDSGTRQLLVAFSEIPSFVASVPTACPPGTYIQKESLWGQGVRGCGALPPGFAYPYASYATNTPLSPEEMTVCPAGFFTNAETTFDHCEQCPVGSYSVAVAPSPFEEPEFCPACASAATVYDRCAACPPGTYAANATDACYPCAPGTYSDVGATECKPCPAGRANPAWRGRTSAACEPCGTGAFSGAGAAECTPCPLGHVAADQGRACAPCRKGTFMAVVQSGGGTTTDRECKTCGPNEHSLDGATSCERCGPGTVASEDLSRCVACKAGTLANGTTGVCDRCPRGQVSPAGAEACEACPEGHVPDTAGEKCLACAPGHYRTAGWVCEACPAPNISRHAAASNCSECPFNALPDDARSACVACEAGYYRSRDAEGKYVCTACEAGTYLNVTAGACVACPAGSVSPRAATECTPCAPGSAQQGPSECERCRPNTVAARFGSTECERCPAGTVSNERGTRCTACPMGSFRPEGRPACAPCPYGTHAPGEGASECQACGAGQLCVLATVAPIEDPWLLAAFATPTPTPDPDAAAASSSLLRRALSSSSSSSTADAEPTPSGDMTTSTFTGGRTTVTLSMPATATEEANNRRLYTTFLYVAVAFAGFSLLVGAAMYAFVHCAGRAAVPRRKRALARLDLLFRADERRRVSGAFFTAFGAGLAALAAVYVWLQFSIANYQIVTSLNPGSSPSAADIRGFWRAEVEFTGYTGPCFSANTTATLPDGRVATVQDVFVTAENFVVGTQVVAASHGALGNASCRVEWRCSDCRVAATTGIRVLFALRTRTTYALALSFNVSVPHAVSAWGNVSVTAPSRVFRGSSPAVLPAYLIPMHFENKDDGQPRYAVSVASYENDAAERTAEDFDLCPPDRQLAVCPEETVAFAVAFEVQQVYLLVSRTTMLSVLSTLANLASLVGAAVAGARYLTIGYAFSTRRLEARGLRIDDVAEPHDDATQPDPGPLDPDLKPSAPHKAPPPLASGLAHRASDARPAPRAARAAGTPPPPPPPAPPVYAPARPPGPGRGRGGSEAGPGGGRRAAGLEEVDVHILEPAPRATPRAAASGRAPAPAPFADAAPDPATHAAADPGPPAPAARAGAPAARYAALSPFWSSSGDGQR